VFSHSQLKYRTSSGLNPELPGKDCRWTIWTLHGAITALVVINQSLFAATVIEAISTASMDALGPQIKNVADETPNATEALPKAGLALRCANVVNGCIKRCSNPALSRANNRNMRPSHLLRNRMKHPAIHQ
jgi:hypothetical protein